MSERASRLRTAIACAWLALAAAPAAAETLILVEPPPALDAAVRASLAPWPVRIVVVERRAMPAEVATARSGGFVAWQDGDQLVLWDASRALEERRTMPPVLDDAAAASLALSIKTWMRLGPLPARPGPETVGPWIDTGAGPAIVEPRPVEPAGRVSLGAEAGLGARFNSGGQGGTEPRVGADLVVSRGPLEVGAGVDLGPGRTLQLDDTSAGTWSAIVVAVHGRWWVPLGRHVAVGPAVGASYLRTTYHGTFGPQSMAVDARANGFGIDTAALAQWRRRGFAVGVAVGMTAMPTGERLHDRAVLIETDPHIEAWVSVRAGYRIQP